MLPPRRVYPHVVGTDIIRNERGEYLVLEDNCRCPSGVSYVLENRSLLHRVFPELFTPYPVRPIKDYPLLLRDTLLRTAPRADGNATVVVLSPGLFNSAFFEHSFLAREMGATLVEGRDLIVEDNHVFMRTTSGRQRVDVIYRRIDDDFLDPLTFRRDDLTYMREHLGELVVKTTGDSGGYGMLMGPFASKKEIDAYAAQMRKN